jgi:hypothetical protein
MPQAFDAVCKVCPRLEELTLRHLPATTRRVFLPSLLAGSLTQLRFLRALDISVEWWHNS